MKENKRLLLGLILCFCSLGFLQAEEIIGRVVDETGESLIGASVLIKGTTMGTVTDFDGNYKLDVPDSKATLIFSYIGMATQELALNGKSILNVTLQSESQQLSEVVAVGYGTMRRRDLTGSVASVDTKELEKVPVSSVAQALNGRISGVNVTQSEGTLDADISIRVRGGMSITQSNEPLYIIDGFPSEAAAFNALNASDIESIDILKDASSTSIYGARGANGVIVVTTKGGREGKANISYEGYFGIKNMANKLDLMSAEEFVLLDYERRQLGGSTATFTERYGEFADIHENYANRGVNWQDLSFQQAWAQSHKVNISGGLKGINYAASYTHQEEDGLMVFSGMKKDNIRLKLDHKMFNKLRINLNVNYNSQKVSGMGTSEGGGNFGKMSSIIMYLPTLGLAATDEELATDPNINTLLDDDGNTMQNPVISARAETNNKELRIFNAGGSIEYEIVKGLKLKSTNGMLYRTQRNDIFNGSESINARRTSINANVYYYDLGRFTTSNVLSYDWRKRKHKISAMVGQEYIKTWNRSLRTIVTNFPNDDIGLNDLSLGLPGSVTSSYNDDDIMLSFFGRIYYNFGEKYMLTLSARADGSSKFGDNNKWGFFPSASFAWRISEEEFVKNWGVFSDLKLRLGYGTAGNNQIPSYQSLGLWSSVNMPLYSSVEPGYVLAQIPNKNLQWEVNKTLNVGLDMGFLNQRIVIAPEFYLNRADNLLVKSKMPLSSGYEFMYRNVGSTQNMGVDITINTVNINTKDFRWMTTLTFSHNRNKVLKLSGEDSYLEKSGWYGQQPYDYQVAVGSSIGLMYGFKSTGLYEVDDFVTTIDDLGKEVFVMDGDNYVLKDGVIGRSDKPAKPGFWKIAENPEFEDGIVDDNDRQVIGDATPDFYGGFNNTFVYKGFDLSIFFNFSYGNDVLNATKIYASSFGWSNKNTLASNGSAHRWITVDGQGAVLSDPSALRTLNSGKTVASWEDMQNGDIDVYSWAVEDGSFLRLSNITLGYTFPKHWMKAIHVSELRLYASANNLYTFTNYSGLDPEVSTRNTTGTTPGVDWGAYPRSRSFMFGLSLTF